MKVSAKLPPLWFVATFAYILALQIIRLYQTSPLDWLLCDYAQRLGTLLILALIPAARAIAYRTQKLRISWGKTLLWIIGLVALNVLAKPLVSDLIDALVPNSALGHYPSPKGWLQIFDLTGGLALVALHEELFFRRCVLAVLERGWGNGIAMIILSATLFAAYHWWTGIGNMAGIFLFGLFAMIMLQRTGALWPLVAAHFISDFIAFA